MDHEHGKRATIEVEIDWHEDDVGGDLNELMDLENQYTDDELKELVIQHIEYGTIKVTWTDVLYLR